MFFIGIFGTNSKVVPCGQISVDNCPVCGRFSQMHVCRRYDYFHIFSCPCSDTTSIISLPAPTVPAPLLWTRRLEINCKKRVANLVAGGRSICCGVISPAIARPVGHSSLPAATFVTSVGRHWIDKGA